MSIVPRGAGSVPTGYAAETFIDDATFRAERHAADRQPPKKRKRKREHKGDASVVDGPDAYKGPWARYEEERPDAASDDELVDDEVEIVYEEDAIAPNPAAPAQKLLGTDYQETTDGETSEFVGSQQADYLGRTYMHVPNDLGIKLTGDAGEARNYIPKRHVHTFAFHTKSITQTRFFPGSGHLLLSAAADAKIALWDVYHSRELLRTFSGHTKSVNDIDFAPDGTQFLSASYDRFLKLWDTETGRCVAKVTTGKTPHVARITPSAPHEIVAGMSDKKIVQFDMRSGKLVQEYDHHLGPVNTITFCDEGRRFVTTSDDKSLRAWEYGIPVPIKFIAEPYMFSMVRSAAHPTGKYIAFQSSDNQITVYAATDRFRQNRKKGFRGHNVAGYAPDVAISPDGQFIASGDSGGFVCFWDWKTCRLFHKIQASESPLLTVQWHPRETSKVATGDLDGVIKYWD